MDQGAGGMMPTRENETAIKSAARMAALEATVLALVVAHPNKPELARAMAMSKQTIMEEFGRSWPWPGDMKEFGRQCFEQSYQAYMRLLLKMS
jgi:hypothetical protein